jgi:hypothetical protein
VRPPARLLQHSNSFAMGTKRKPPAQGGAARGPKRPRAHD